MADRIDPLAPEEDTEAEASSLPAFVTPHPYKGSLWDKYPEPDPDPLPWGCDGFGTPWPEEE
jgi:hypothetical protein